MTAFIQVIEWSSSRIDEVRALGESRRADMASRGGPVRLTITADRKQPQHYMTIVEFSSYEDAMRNSQDPATHAFAQEMARLCDGPPVFHDLDVVETHIMTPGQRTAATTTG
jgi:hypothetical protein